MITRPLDLASRLRPEPRNFDWLFFANAGLLGLFFSLFGSHFVLAPGLGVDFQLPVVEGANASAKTPTHVISVLGSGQILTSDGWRTLKQLEDWLIARGKTTKTPRLLVRGDADVSTDVFTAISGAAKKAGFEVIWATDDPAGRKGQKGR